MALTYTPVTYTGPYQADTTGYRDGATHEIDHAGNRLFRWVWHGNVTIGSSNPTHPIYQFYSQPGGPVGYGYSMPTSQYQIGELVVFDMNTKTEAYRLSFPGLMTYMFGGGLNAQATTEWNTYLSGVLSSTYTSATAYDVSPNWETLSQFTPHPFLTMTMLEGSDWLIARVNMFTQIKDTPSSGYAYSYYNGYIWQAYNSKSVRYIAINVVTGEWVPYQVPLTDGYSAIGGIVKVSESKYALVVGVEGTGNSKLVSYVFDTSSQTWTRTTPYDLGSTFLDTRISYYSEWNSAPIDGTSGGTLLFSHRSYTYGADIYRNTRIARAELNSSGAVTNYTVINTVTGANEHKLHALYYVPADNTVVVVKEDNYTTPGVYWLKYNATTGALVYSGTPVDSYGDTFFATTAWGGYGGYYHKLGYESKLTSSSSAAAHVGSYNEGTHMYPYIMNLETMTATPWARFVPYWTPMDVWGYWLDVRWVSFDESRQGLWVDWNPDPGTSSSSDPYTWTFVSAPTTPPTMGLCFLEETDAAYKDFQDRYPD